MALKAPRALKLPAFCRDSALSQISTPTRSESVRQDNPTEVRIRFVDRTNLQSSNVAPNVQNYGIDFHVYEAAGFTAPVNATSAKLNLPPALPVPGSNTQGTASIAITFASSAAAFASDTSINGDGVVGVTDRARNGLVQNVAIGYSVQTGPQIGNNPSPPDLTLLAHGTELVPVSSGKITTGSIPVVFGGTVTGQLNAPPVTLDDQNVLGEIIDIEFGRFINAASPTNQIHNPPRRVQIPTPVTSNNGDPAIPFPQGGIPENNLRNIITPPFPPPVPVLGTYLYVADGTHHEVRIFDSTTYTPLGILVGVPSPGGLGISPDLNSLYISNVDQGTVMRVGSNSLQTATFHQVVNTISVGAQPRAVSVNPANEDVFVVNAGENSVSIIDVPGQAERTRITVGAGPRDVFITDRFTCTGCTFAYMAFVTNFFGNSVSVYESDSPSNQVNNGPQGKVIDTLGGFQGPSGGTWNRWSNIGFTPVHMGAYIVNSTGTTIENRGATAFGLSPQPGFQGQPGFRTFSTVAVYSTGAVNGSPADCTIDNLSALSAVIGDAKNLAKADIQGAGIPSVLLVSYPTAGKVAAFDLNTPSLLGTVDAAGTAMYSYYDQ